MLMSTNIASTGPTEHTKDVDKAEDKALVYTEEIVIRIHIVKDIYIEEDTREAKKIEDSNKKSATFMINKAAG
jgi:hypothetical protein